MQTTLVRTAEGGMPYFKALDGVRAYCVLLVMFDHLKAGGHTPGWVNGHLGVDIFFILSGFLITTLLWREQVITGRIDLRSFYTRRTFRIVPVYAAVLVLYVLVLQARSQAARWIQFRAGLPYFLSFMNEYAREPHQGTVFLHTWSLGVEEKFYLIWPVLGFLLVRRNGARVILLATLLAAVALAALLGLGYLARAYFGLITGCLMAATLAGPWAGQVFSALRRMPATLVLGVFALGFYAEHVSKNLMFVFSFSTVFFLSFLLAGRSWLSRIHEAAALRWLGRRSYSMYLVHILCLNAIESRIRIDSGLRAAAVLIAAYALSAFAAEILYRTIEQPARNLGRSLLAKRHEVPAAM